MGSFAIVLWDFSGPADIHTPLYLLKSLPNRKPDVFYINTTLSNIKKENGVKCENLHVEYELVATYKAKVEWNLRSSCGKADTPSVELELTSGKLTLRWTEVPR